MKDYKDMTFKESLLYLPTRTINMIAKLLGMKGVVLVTTMYLIKFNYIPDSAIGYVWIFIILIVVFGEKALTFIKDIKK